MNERLEGATLYRAMVKVWDPAAGEWVVTAEAVDTLEGLVSWAALGVGASAENSGRGGQDPSLLWWLMLRGWFLRRIVLRILRCIFGRLSACLTMSG